MVKDILELVVDVVVECDIIVVLLGVKLFNLGCWDLVWSSVFVYVVNFCVDFVLYFIFWRI